jgi:hypothetical protein
LATALVAATTLVILPKLAAYNALLLVPALLFLIARYQRSKDSLLSRATTKAAFACQLWQWLTAGLLSLASLVLPSHWVRAAAHVPDYTSFALWPITLLALIMVSAAPLEHRIAT